MKVMVIGVGGVGCALAVAAVKAGMETAVLAKGATAKSIHEYGLKRTGIFGEIAIPTGGVTVFEDYDSIEPTTGLEPLAKAISTSAD